MKKLLFLMLVIMSGCSLIDAYNLKYDSIEYSSITEIRTTASLAKASCLNPVQSSVLADSISIKTLNFANYTQYRSDIHTFNAAIKLNEIAQGLHKDYEKGAVSSMFCLIKFEEIEKSAEVMQKIIGAKP